MPLLAFRFSLVYHAASGHGFSSRSLERDEDDVLGKMEQRFQWRSRIYVAESRRLHRVLSI
jgi:hypothetical protein